MTAPHRRVEGAAAAWGTHRLSDLLAEQGLLGVQEGEFPNDGWSGATLTSLVRADGRRFVLKRTSWAADWIARSTRDHAIREAVVAATPVDWRSPLAPAHLGAAADGRSAAILMPDLSASLIPWHQGGAEADVVDGRRLDLVLEAMAALHAMPWRAVREVGDEAGDGHAWPWCPIRERVELLTPASAERYRAGGLPVGQRFLDGWGAFDRLAPPEAVSLVRGLSAEIRPLLAALSRLPATGLHGDLKLANVALLPSGGVSLIDWQLTTFAPVAVELGWFLVSNVGQLADAPDAVLERYRAAAAGAGVELGDWAAQRDLAILVGLVLRGWRKGLDAEAGELLPSGTSAADDLAWWGQGAVEAAARRL